MYDLVVIGAGWAGFSASIRAKEMGLKVALIERKEVGGTCLNLGCIPTKSLIHAARIFDLVNKSSDFGVISSKPSLNFLKVLSRKDRTVDSLRSGMVFMLKGIDLFKGEPRIISAQDIVIDGRVIKTRFIIVATGSKPLELKGFEFDYKKVLSSNEALALKEAPSSLLVIGGGAIGCEFANLFSTFGSHVTIIEREKQLLPGEDSDIAFKLEAIFKKNGINVKTGVNELSVNKQDYNLILVCIGRVADTNIPGLKELGVKLDRGRVITDDYLKTDVDNIYAAGDCTSRIMLAHLSGYQGRAAVENIFNDAEKQKAYPLNIPNCIFTNPEISSSGLSIEQARKEEIKIDIRKFDFMASGMARILDETRGFLKIISDSTTGAILGFSMIGPSAAEIAGLLSLAISCRLKVKDIKATVFAHPSISEAIGEALK